MAATTSLKRLSSQINLPMANKRCKTNAMDSVSSLSEQPRPNDVLSGRGGLVNSHQGNITFRRVVNANKKKYHSFSNKSHKTILAQSIVEAILNKKGRFLTKSKPGRWVEVEKQKAIQKTCQALREGAEQFKSTNEKTEETGGKLTTNKVNENTKYTLSPPTTASAKCLRKMHLINLIVPPKPHEVGKKDRIVKYEIEETDGYLYDDSSLDTNDLSWDSELDEEDFDLSSDGEHPLDSFDNSMNNANRYIENVNTYKLTSTDSGKLLSVLSMRNSIYAI